MTEITPVTPHLDDEAIVALLDGETAGDERQDGEGHLELCADCRARRDELAGASALVATPVEPLADDLKNAMVFRAIMAGTAEETEPAPGAGQAAATAPVVPMKPRRKAFSGYGSAAAALVIVVGVGLGLWTARALLGSNGPAVSAPGTRVASPALAPPILELRAVAPGTPSSCPSVASPDPAKAMALPYVTDSPARTQTCVSVGPSLLTMYRSAPTTISGPPGLTGPDSLSITLDTAMSGTLRSLQLVTSHGSGSGMTLPGGAALVAVGDGAVIGVVAGVKSGPGGQEVVEVTEISPAVAEYLDTVLNG